MDSFSAGTPDGRYILGPCPVCDAWQLEADRSVPDAEIEAILLEHDNTDHPGALVRMARLRQGVPLIQVTHPQELWE